MADSSRVLLAAVVALGLACALPSQAAVSKSEARCSGKVGGGAVKLAATVVKETMKCRDADISGKSLGSCPNS